MKTVSLLKSRQTDLRVYTFPYQLADIEQQYVERVSGAAWGLAQKFLFLEAGPSNIEIERPTDYAKSSYGELALSNRDYLPLHFFPDEEDDYDSMEDEGQRIINLPVALRLRAARIGAGFMITKVAAEALGMSAGRYRNAEYGYDTVGPKLLRGVKKIFGISEEYLLHGVSSGNAADELAHRIWLLLQNASGEDPGRGERLQQMRIRQGFQNAAASARAMGWKVPTYVGHEGNYFDIPVDRAIGYALAFEHRPEYMIYGELPHQDEKPLKWKEHTKIEPEAEQPTYAPWLWSRDLSRGKNRKISLLEFDDNDLVLASKPRMSIPNDIPSRNETKLFGILFDDYDTTIIVIAGRPPHDGEIGLGSRNGELVEMLDLPKKIPDPLTANYSKDSLVPLGTKLAEYRLPKRG